MHLGVADDLIVFTKANSDDIMEVVKVLNEFHAISGLKFNHEIYMAGIPDSESQILSDSSGFHLSRPPFCYLGVPLTAGKLKSSNCRILFEIITKRLSYWKSKSLSYVGKI